MVFNQKNNKYLYLLKDMKFLTLCLFTFFLGYEYWEEAYIFGSFTITKLLGLLYFLYSTIYFKKSFSINNDNKKQLIYLLLLSFFIILSTLKAHIFHASDLKITSIIIYLQFFIFYWIVSNEVRGSIYKKNMLLVFLILGVLSIYILAVNNIGLQTASEGESLESTEGITRLWFMGMNPNTLGSLTSLASISLTYFLLHINIASFKKLILISLLIPLIHLMFLSGSLGALLSLIIGLFILIFLDRKVFFSRNIIVIVIFSSFLFYFSVNYDDSNYLLDKLAFFLNTGSTSNRVEVWKYNFDIASDFLIFGQGLDSGLRTSHNIFLDVFVWTGILGFFAYTLFIISIFIKSMHYYLKYNRTFELAIFSCIFLILLKSGGAFTIKYVWLLLAVITVHSEKKPLLT